MKKTLIIQALVDALESARGDTVEVLSIIRGEVENRVQGSMYNQDDVIDTEDRLARIDAALAKAESN